MEGQKFSQDKLPIYTLVCKQFPLAIQEVAKSTLGGHKKYISTDLQWDNFSKVKDPQFQYLNAAMRHLIEAESHTFNEDMKEYGDIRHKAQAIWNLMASLELEMREIHTRDKKSEIPEDIDKIPLTKEEYYPFELPENITHYSVISTMIPKKEMESFSRRLIIDEIDQRNYFSRPMLSVDQLLNQEDEYPDFNDS